MKGKVYLIPCVLHEDENALNAIPPYITCAVKQCSSFFVENKKTARRFIKKIYKDFVVDDHFWMAIQKVEEETVNEFVRRLSNGETIGILSEAGCPGVADPGQILVAKAQEIGVQVMPLVGPNSMLLALMASGMNGQQFEFTGYLPIESNARKKAIKEMEERSGNRNATIIFIETPYRNNALVNDIVQTCKASVKLCIAVDITAPTESIRTKTTGEWKKNLPDIHKRPAIFLLYAGAH